MNVENLATVMGINLLKPQIEDPITVMKGKNASLMCLTCESCCENCILVNTLNPNDV